MDTDKHSVGRLRIYVEAGLDRGIEVPIPYEGARLGRASTNSMGLQDPALSRHHCQLFFKPGSGLWVRDLESANGTHVNGQEIAEARLHAGDTLSIGDTIIRIKGSDSPDGPEEKAVSAPPSPSDPEEMPHPEIPGLVMLEEIGEGAMAAVWKARQESLDRIVAVKILRPELTTDETEVDDFVNEARAAAKLLHPNVVQVYDAAQYGKTCYIVMEYVEGQTLGQWLRDKGPMPHKDAFRIIRRIADGLDQAWRKAGIVHRDIKPDNIIISKDGTPKVADLGLARIADPATLTAKVRRGALEGTPNYMSPEQARGDERIDCRSDMYSLGATLYHMLTGKMPFEDTSPLQVPDKQITAQIPNPRNIDPTITLGAAQFISRLMMKDPARRFDNWKEVLGTMRKIQAGGLILGKQAGESISTIAAPVTQTEVSSANGRGSRRRRAGTGRGVPVMFRALAWTALLIWFVILAHNRLAQKVRPMKTQPIRERQALSHLPASDDAPVSVQISPPPRIFPARSRPQPVHAFLTDQVDADRKVLSQMQPEDAPSRMNELTPEERTVLRKACDAAARHVVNHQFLAAYEILDAATGASTSQPLATEIEYARSMVLAAGRMNQTITESIRNHIGEEVEVHVKGSDHAILLQAMSGDTVNGAITRTVKGNTVTNAVLFKVSSLDPIERSRWLGPANTPEKCAMKYLLYMERGDYEMALQFAQNCGHFSETLAEIAGQQLLGGEPGP